VIKPILFLQNPDAVHERMLKIGRIVQKSKLIRGLLNSVWSYQNQPKLGQNILGLNFPNPVGIAAGFDKNLELPQLLKSIGFGFMEGGSITYQPCEGNPKPWFYRLPKTKSIVVHAGLANSGVKEVADRTKNYPPNTFDNFALNVSVAPTNIKATVKTENAVEDFVNSLTYLKQMGIGEIMTINVSCPNVQGSELFTNPGNLELLLDRIDKIGLAQPIFLKMPTDLAWSDFNKLLQVAAGHKVVGVTIGNLSKERGTKVIDSLPDNIRGNLSGRPVWDLSNYLIQKTYQNYQKRFVIIGVGGIFTAQDAYTKIKLGASLVELITGLIFEGPQLIGAMNRELAMLMEKDGYTNISEAIGVEA